MKRTPVCLAFLLTAVALFLPAAASASQVVVVTPTPSDPVQSGNDLLDALDDITDANWGKRYVLKIEPGVYNLGNQNLVMKEFVDVAGCGTKSTLIFGNGNLAVPGNDRGLIEGADNAELRDLSIRVFPAEGRQHLVPIYLPGVSPRITNVHTEAFGSDNYCTGIFARGYTSVIENVRIRSACTGFSEGIGLLGISFSARPSIVHADVSTNNTGSSGLSTGLFLGTITPPAEIRDSRFLAFGGDEAIGIYLPSPDNSPSTIATTSILDTTFAGKFGGTASYGVLVRTFLQPTPNLAFKHSTVQAAGSPSNVAIDLESCAGSVRIRFENGLIEGSTHTVDNSCGFLGTVEVGSSRMAGGSVTGTGTITCAGVYDESFTFSAGSCP